MTTALTLAEALMLFDEEIEALSFDDVHFKPAEAKAAVAAWSWLVAADSDEAREAARAEVLDDTPLMAHLHQSAAQFLRWWRGEEWEHFTRSEREGEGWAWAVLDRARQACVDLGTLAGEVSMAAAVARPPR